MLAHFFVNEVELLLRIVLFELVLQREPGDGITKRRTKFSKTFDRVAIFFIKRERKS